MPQREQRVTPLELFFDLVYVYAITQVTLLMSDDPTWHGLGRGLLVLAALWWAWTGYAWLTNTLEPEEGAVRAGMFGAMAAMLSSPSPSRKRSTQTQCCSGSRT
jgi:low temperature requirement protein LtrA